jgi:glycosyltransferase involved in cell wall biosynthesis
VESQDGSSSSQRYQNDRYCHMPERLKVLLSAYACEPNKGSEPEVGWQWAMQMALYHDITVLTRSNNREGIEKALEPLQGKRPLPRFVYHDEKGFLLWLKNRFHTIRLYYIFWQISAWNIIAQLNRENQFDILHHVTFAGFRYRTAIWNHGVPTIWGPVGGIQSIPWRLLPWKYPSPLLLELFRHFNNFAQSAPFHFLPRRARITTITLVSTPEMEEIFQRLDLETTLMPTIGFNAGEMSVAARELTNAPLKVLFVGSIITLKGIDLAIQAMAEAGTTATFTVIGSGKFEGAARRLVRQLGIESKVEFRGRLPLRDALNSYANFDLFLFPSLHDTGGYALIEAMSCGMPVVCLDCGGPRLAVKEGTGIKVPLGARKDVVAGLAKGIRFYDQNRQLLLEHGRAAREVILREYDWERKGRELDAIYQKAVAGETEILHGGIKRRATKSFVERLSSAKGLVFFGIILFIIGTAGFLSVEKLKHDAQAIVEDTLPGLADASAANASLAQSLNRSLLMLTAATPAERATYRKALDAFSEQTSESLDLYERTKFTGPERGIYNELMDKRQKYRAVRITVLALLDQQKQSEAVQTCNDSMIPAYLEYKTAAEKLLKFNVQQGKSRGHSILKICLITQYVVAGIGVILFVAGFFIGLFK